MHGQNHIRGKIFKNSKFYAGQIK